MKEFKSRCISTLWYTAKNYSLFHVSETRGNNVMGATLFGIVKNIEPESVRKQVQQCRTTMNNIARTTLLHPVFKNL